MKVHAEKQPDIDPYICLPRKTAEVFRVEFAEKDHRGNVARMLRKFELGASIQEIRKSLRLIADSRSDCKLTKGETLLADGMTVTTFYLICDQSSGDMVWMYDFDFYFKDGKLTKIDYSQVTTPRKEV